jgi:hypothetical protein
VLFSLKIRWHNVCTNIAGLEHEIERNQP